MALPTLDPRERHKAWTDQQAIADAEAANRRALRDAVVAYEDQTAGMPTWQDPDAGRGGGAMEVNSEAGLDAAIQGLDRQDEQQIQQNLAGAPPSQFDVAHGAAIRGGASDAEAQAIRDALLGGHNVPSSPNPLRPIREQYTNTMLGDGSTVTDLDAGGNVVQRPTGLVNDEDWQTQQLQAAQVEEQRAHAAAYGQEAGRQQARIDVMEMKAQRDAQRRQDAIAKSQMVMTKMSRAADRLNEAPDIDPNRYWASQSAGRKALWAIQAALAGFAGLDPLGALSTAINMDIDAQKASFAQKQSGFAARDAELSGARSVYADIRESVGDEQASDMMMESARLQQAEAAFKAMAVKEGIPPQIAEQNVFLTQLRQRNAEIWKTLEEMLATTPERIGGGFRPNIAGFQRKVLEGALKDASARGAKMGELAITQGGSAAADASKAHVDLQKAEIEAGGKKAETRRQHSFEQRKWVAEKVEPYRNELSLIEDFKKAYPNEIPSISWGVKPTTITDDQIKAYEALKRIVMVRLRRESGAAISDKELAADADAVLNAMDEDDVRNMLDAREGEARRRIDFFERAPDEEEVETVNRAKTGERAPIASGGAGLPDVVSWDD